MGKASLLTLFLAAVPDVKSEGDVINGILKEHGVKYSHINEHILTANPIEEERSKAAVKVCSSQVFTTSAYLFWVGKARENPQSKDSKGRKGEQGGCYQSG